MSDKIFLDTNILVYCFSVTEPDKQQMAQEIAQKEESVISVQVLQELANVLNRKFRISWPEINQAILDLTEQFIIHTNSSSTIQMATMIAEKYKYSFYDSLILSAALEHECTTIYSEDLHSGQIIEEKLGIVNPFAVLPKG